MNSTYQPVLIRGWAVFCALLSIGKNKPHFCICTETANTKYAAAAEAEGYCIISEKLYSQSDIIASANRFCLLMFKTKEHL